MQELRKYATNDPDFVLLPLAEDANFYRRKKMDLDKEKELQDRVDQLAADTAEAAFKRLQQIITSGSPEQAAMAISSFIALGDMIF